MNKAQKQSVGFIYGYKDSSMTKNENNDTVISISFKGGTSNSFPSKFMKLKDFWAQEIFVGDISELHIIPAKFKEVFEFEMKEINDDLKYKISFNNEIYGQRKYYFDFLDSVMTLGQFTVLTAFSMAHLHVTYQSWENDDVLEQSLKECVGEAFINEQKSVLEIYKSFTATNQFIYEKETCEAFA